MGTATGALALTIAVTNDSTGDGVTGLAKIYTEQTGIEIEIVEAPYANIFEQEANAALTRSGIFDLFLMDDPWIPFFAENGYLEDLTPFLEAKGLDGWDDDMLRASRRICQNPYGEGPYVCVPMVGNAQLFFYDPDKFAEVGFPDGPETWDDVIEAAGKLTEIGGGRTFGYSMRAAEGNPVVADFMPIFWSYGASLFDEDRNVSLDTDEARQAIDVFLQLAAVAPPGVESFNADEVGRGLAQGVAYSAINWPNWVATFEDPTQSRVVGTIAHTTIPNGTRQGSSEIGHWALGMSIDSEDKQVAFDFMLWATLPEQIIFSAEEFSNAPVRVSAFTDPGLTAQDRFRHYPTLMDVIEASTPRPRHPRWPEIENVFGRHLTAAVAGTVSGEEALLGAQEAITELLAR